MRIVTGGISHETSTFAPTPTTLHEFETGLGLFRGAGLVERFRGTNNCTGGFIAASKRAHAGPPRDACCSEPRLPLTGTTLLPPRPGVQSRCESPERQDGDMGPATLRESRAQR
jgi:hypothetical protein